VRHRSIRIAEVLGKSRRPPGAVLLERLVGNGRWLATCEEEPTDRCGNR
jgi:hypothetical protein